MSNRFLSAVLLALLFIAPAQAQLQTISISAGSDADKASTAIGLETDPQKKIALLTEFVQKFADDKMALAYGYQNLASQYQITGDMAKAVDAGEKAYAALPNNMDIVMVLVSVAQSAKNNEKTVVYAVKGAELINSLGKQPKPEGTSDEAFADQVKQQRESLQTNYDFFEVAAYNSIAAEDNPKTRIAYIDQFTPAFPKSKFTQNIAQFAILSLQQMNEPGKVADFGEKILASNPDDLPTLVLLANSFAEEQNGAHLAKATQYAHRAIELAKADQPGADKQRVLSAGIAHSALGWVLMRQDKTLPAIAELKQAAPMLKEDPATEAMVLYRLGYAYAKLGKLPEAKTVLADAIRIDGPYRQPSKELLDKVNSAKPGAPRPRAR